MVESIRTSQLATRLLDRIESTRWCINCGRAFATESIGPLVRVPSWEASERALLHQDSRDFSVSIRNECYRMIQSTPQYGSDDLRVKRFNDWTDVVRPNVLLAGERAADATPFTGEAKVACANRVARLLMIGVASIQFGLPDEYISLRIVELLIEGHLVLGWQGDYPAGSLVVY